MPIVQLEHRVRDFATWKAAFDRDPVHRRVSGVRRHAVYRPLKDPGYVAVDLEFDTTSEAEAFADALRALWQSPTAAPVLAGEPRLRIVDVVERQSY